MSRQPSAYDKVLLAAIDLDTVGNANSDDKGRFTVEALTVASWQKFPRTFGLKYYADQYPNHNAVIVALSGAKGLVKRGWLDRVGPGLYVVTKLGRQHALQLTTAETNGNGQAHGSESVTLTIEQDELLTRLLESAVVGHWQMGQRAEITFSAAARFYGVPAGATGAGVDEPIARVQLALKTIAGRIGEREAVLASGRSVSAVDLHQLHQVDEYLAERYGRHFTLMRNTRKAALA